MTVETSPDYWQHVRREIGPLLPPNPARILEIGCGAGGTLAWLKQRWPEAETVGIDGFAPILPDLERNADKAIITDLDHPMPDVGQFDLILALDILEHLHDPWQVLKDTVGRLAAGGHIIVSVPNLSHHSVLSRLIIHRQFDYVDEGILDRTHLRFFTETTAIGMMNGAGLRVIGGVVNGWEQRRARLVRYATAGLLKHYFAKQYIMLAEVGDGQGPVNWMSRA